MKTNQLSSSFIPKISLFAAIVLGSVFTQLTAQCTNFSDAGGVRYGIRVINATSNPIQYEAYANPTGNGCQFVGSSQFSLVISSGASVSILNNNSSGIAGFTWTNNTNVVNGGFKYAAVATQGSSGGAAPFNANDETSLFIFTINGPCTAGVRVFDNINDPSSAVLNGDFRNNFFVLIPPSTARESYVANVSTTLQCPAVILPLTLTDFSARAVSNKQVMLSWQTLNETNTKQFVVERSSKLSSANSTDWQTAGTLTAAGTVAGNRSYQLIDNQPYNGISYYRLRTVDVDGKQTYSDIKKVNFNGHSLLSSAVYPNPVEHSGFVTLTTTETIRYRLLDQAGRTISAGTFALGNSKLKVPAAAGAYILEVSGIQNDSDKEHHRIIVQ